MAMETSDRRALKVLMLPWLAYGHISPFLELAKSLSCHDVSVFLCSTPANLNTVRGSIPETYSSSIRLVEILLPELPDLPPHYHTTKALPPRLNSPLMAAFDEAGPTLSGVIADVAPDLLIYDVLLPWAQPVARSHGVPAVVFLTVSMAAASLCMHFAKRRGEAHPIGTSYVPGLRSAAERNARVQPQGKPSGSSNLERCLQSIEGSSDIVLLKSIKELEGKHMEYLETLTGKKVVLVGMPARDDLDPQQDAKELIDWLDTKERSSTVFISFGSECFLGDEEREEMAYGLELSEVNFIWVIRFPEGEEIKLEDALPGGFLERVGNRGVVVEKWAPQARILAHSSIGGFLSHCGWGSVTEGMRFGVPIVAMPMQNDQPLNAGIVKESGVGVEVGGLDVGRMDRNEIAKAVRHVLIDENGEGVRKKAREMGEIIRNRGDAEIDELVVELNKICGSLKHWEENR